MDIPWIVGPSHRGSRHLQMLQTAQRIGSGVSLQGFERRRYAAWLGELRDLNAVVRYDPTTPDGFCLVPRMEGDGDLTTPPMIGEGEIR